MGRRMGDCVCDHHDIDGTILTARGAVWPIRAKGAPPAVPILDKTVQIKAIFFARISFVIAKFDRLLTCGRGSGQAR